MFLSGLKCLSRLERQVKFAKNRCCKIKPVAVYNLFKITKESCSSREHFIPLGEYYILEGLFRAA